MARRNGRYRPYFKRRRFNRRSRVLRKRVRRVERQVRRVASTIETKRNHNYQTNQTVEFVTNATQTYNLSGIDQGVDHNERIGDQIRATSCSFKYMIRGPTAVSLVPSDVYNLVRVVIVKIKSKYTSPTYTPFWSDIFDTDDSTPIGTILSPYKWVNRKTFRILYDRTHNVSDYASSSTDEYYWNPNGNYVVTSGFNRKRLGFTISYTDLTTGVSQNGIYLLINSSSSAAPHPLMYFHWTLKYQDA